MKEARSRGRDDHASIWFTSPSAAGGASFQTSSGACDGALRPPSERSASGAFPRDPSADGSHLDPVTVSGRESADRRAPHHGGVWAGHLPPKVVIPLLASLVAAQAIALMMLVRKPATGIAHPDPAAVAHSAAAARPGPTAAAVPNATTIARPPSAAPLAASPAPTALSVDGEPGAAVFIDGQRRGVAPLKVTGVPPGRHQVRLATGAGSTATQDVTVAVGSSTAVLFPAPRSGWITFRVPFNVAVFEGSRQIAASNDGPISLPAGAHTLTLRNDELGFRSDVRVTVTGGGMALLRPTIPQGILQVNALPWANVYVDGEPVGDTPLGQLRVAVGPHELRFVHPQLGERVQRVNVTAQDPARVAVDLR